MMTVRTPRVLLLAVPLALVACRDAKVATYRIPKETAAHPAQSTPAAPGSAMPATMSDTGGLAVASADAGTLTWTAPATWKAKSGSAMRKGTYLVGEETGANADLSITAFPGDVGGDLANVNRWRGQVSLPPIAASELAAALTSFSVGTLDVKVVDLAGGTKEAPVRMLGAIVPFGSSTWFFKLTGPDALVAKEKSNFLAFLQTLKVSTQPLQAPVTTPAAPITAAPTPAPVAAEPAPAAPTMANTAVKTARGPGLKWTAPSHWQEKPASSMRKATYGISGPKGAAELAITAFPGDVGGDLPNLNRWRGQLSLPPVEEAQYAANVTKLSVNGLTITVADITGPGENPTRLLGAMVPYGGSTWFFKLTGSAALVADEKPAFLAFLQTIAAP